MAQDTITLKLLIEDSQIKGATASIDKQSKAIDKNTKKKKQGTQASNRHNKAEKALYQTNLSASKGFSKMNQTMGGSSGVVAAYATLAANVFALTAAFGALSRAAQVTQLEKGLQLMGNQSGRTLSIMADGLREVTGMAISAEEAMRGAAMGVSGGFGGAELKGLAKIAKGASIALGRDLSDAFDRLTRGAIKLEPEILDELGIMVRVDEAAENYAATIGKTATQLTQFEKRQAFMNAILEQGALKFGDIAEQVDPDPYARLAATFADLTRAAFQWINIGLGPVVGFLANNMTVLAGVTVMFASTIAGKMLPFLGEAGATALATADKMKGLANETREFAAASVEAATKQIGTTGAGGKLFREVADSAKDGILDQEELEKATKSLGYSERKLFADRKKAAITGRADNKIAIANIKKEQANLQFLINQKKIEAKLDQKAAILQAKAGLAQKSGAAIQGYTMGVQNFGQAFGQISKASEVLADDLDDITRKALKLGKSDSIPTAAANMNRLKVFTEKTKNQARLLGAAFLKALPWIGALVVVLGVGYALYKRFFETDKMREYKKHLKDIETIQESLPKKVEEYNKAMNASSNLAENQVKQWQILSGVMAEISGIIKTDIKLMQELAAAGDLDKIGFKGAEKGGTSRAKPVSDFETARQAGLAVLSGIIPANESWAKMKDDAIVAFNQIQDSGTIQAMGLLLDSEFEGVSESMQNNLREALRVAPKDTSIEGILKWLDEALRPAIGRTIAEYEQMGPAADSFLKSLKDQSQN